MTDALTPGSSLSPSERRVARLVAKGLRNKEVATSLCLSEQTVKNHLSMIFQKLGITNRAQIILAAKDHPEWLE
jgi:two-component system nitrate/nitrite response regulator NarL